MRYKYVNVLFQRASIATDTPIICVFLRCSNFFVEIPNNSRRRRYVHVSYVNVGLLVMDDVWLFKRKYKPTNYD